MEQTFSIPTHPEFRMTKSGNVWSVKKLRWEKYYWINGYKTYCINRRTVGMHRLVAETFIPNPENLSTVNHIDGDKLNNSIENLEWLSSADNMKHAWRTGLCWVGNRGSKNGRAKLTEDKVRLIKNLLGTKSQGAIATKFNVDPSIISEIKTGKIWNHV